jgi:hypothetical protein
MNPKKLTTKLLILWVIMAASFESTSCTTLIGINRWQKIKNIGMGMSAEEVIATAGEPQGREAFATKDGPVEAWDYHVVDDSGTWVHYFVGMKKGQVATLGVAPTQLLMKGEAEQASVAATSKLEAALYQVYVAAYLGGYRQGQQDRDAEWNEAVASLAPQVQQTVKEHEARAYAAGRKAGEEQAAQEMKKAWDEYLSTEKEELQRRFTF